MNCLCPLMKLKLILASLISVCGEEYFYIGLKITNTEIEIASFLKFTLFIVSMTV